MSLPGSILPSHSPQRYMLKGSCPSCMPWIIWISKDLRRWHTVLELKKTSTFIVARPECLKWAIRQLGWKKAWYCHGWSEREELLWQVNPHNPMKSKLGGFLKSLHVSICKALKHSLKVSWTCIMTDNNWTGTLNRSEWQQDFSKLQYGSNLD